MNFLRLAKVAETHPEDNSVDIVMVDDGSRYAGAICATPFAAKNSGVSNMPSVTPAGADKWDLTVASDDAQLAIVGFLGPTAPIVLGFLFPQVNQVLFKDKNRRIDRHASDVYTSTDAAGNFELFHPSGTYMRVGTAAEHEDLTGKDFDAKWAIGKNTDKAVFVRLLVANAGAQKAVVTIDPDGNINIDHAGDLTTHTAGKATLVIDGDLSATVGGALSADVTGAATLKAPSVKIDSPATTCTGALTVQGAFSYQAGMSGSGGGSISGSLTNNGKNVGSTHTHSGVRSGPDNSGTPN